MSNKLYNVLIVDDEPIIANRLKCIFEQYPTAKVFCAFNGMRAKEIAESEKIDIAFLDICMPQITGIELMHFLKSRFGEIRIAFLTGQRSFDYAYQTLEQDHVKYILKSDGEKKIRNTFESFISEIQQQSEDSILIAKAREALEELSPQLLSKLLTKVVNGDDYRHSFIEELYPKNFNLDDGFVFIVASINSTIDFALKAHILSHLHVTLRSIINEDNIIFDAPEDYQFCILIKASYFENSQSNYGELFEKIQNLFFRTYNIGVSFVGNSTPITIERLRSQYLSFCNFLTHSNGMEVLLMEDKNPAIFSPVDVNIDYYITQLLSSLEQNNQSEYSNLCLLILQAASSDNTTLMLIWYKVMGAFVKLEINYGIMLLPKEELSPNIDSLWTVITQTGTNFFTWKENTFCRSTNEVIESTNAYILQNLDKDLSLTTLAKRVYLNSSYFSRLYRQISGQTITEFISVTKMEQAKNMLKNTDEKICNIAHALGFESPYYFTVYFKKHEGIPPSEYKINFA